MKKLICLLVMATLCGGCATVGKPINQEKMKQLQDGVTTKDEVLQTMGEPSDKTIIDTGEEKWIYGYSRSKPTWSSFVPGLNWFESGTNVKGEKLEVLFDSKGVVKNHVFTTPTTTVKTGIIQ